MLWWDTRRLGEPTEKLQLKTPQGTVLGGSSMAYNTEAGPTKYLVGTEQGVVLSINTVTKSKTMVLSSMTKGQESITVLFTESNVTQSTQSSS